MSPSPRKRRVNPAATKKPRDENKRLEEVRNFHGLSLKDFYDRLRAGLTASEEKKLGSRAAARTYHTNRMVRPFYHARVARVFGVSLEWLITGEGDMHAARKPTDDSSEGPLPLWGVARGGVREGFPQINQFPIYVEPMVMEAVFRLAYGTGRFASLEDLHAAHHEMGQRVGRALRLPLEALGIISAANPDDPPSVTRMTLNAYLGAMAATLLAVIPRDWTKEVALAQEDWEAAASFPESVLGSWRTQTERGGDATEE